jgi:hypothetical protein
LNSALLKGVFSLERISAKFKIPLKYLRYHQENCLPQGGDDKEDNYETLQALLCRVIEDLDSAQSEYRFSGDPKEAASAAAFYGTLLKEARELVVTLSKLRSNTQLVQEMNTKILEPFRHELGRMLLEEGSELKREMQATLGSSYTPKLDAVVRQAWKNLAIRLLGESAKLEPSLLAVLNQEKRGLAFEEDRVLAALGKPGGTVH